MHFNSALCASHSIAIRPMSWTFVATFDILTSSGSGKIFYNDGVSFIVLQNI